MTNREQVALELFQHAVRWHNNVLTELLHNHGEFVGDDQREAIHRLIAALADTDGVLRGFPRATAKFKAETGK